jgi:hypothetical protein
MRVAGAIGVGYLLGRRRKLRTATVMAVAAAAGGTSVGRTALRRGAKQLVTSGVLDKVPPQVGEIVDAVRGDLLDAGKAAASAAVTNKIDSLTDSLHDAAERLRNPGAAVAEGAGTATGAARDTAEGAAGAARGAAEGAGAATGAARDTAEGAAGAARGAASGATRRLRGRGTGEFDEDDTYARDEAEEAEEAEETEAQRVPRQRTTARRRPIATRTRG